MESIWIRPALIDMTRLQVRQWRLILFILERYVQTLNGTFPSLTTMPSAAHCFISSAGRLSRSHGTELRPPSAVQWIATWLLSLANTTGEALET